MLLSFPNLHVVDHPLVLDKLSRLRSKDCAITQFRYLVRRMTLLIAYEALRDLPLTTTTIETPLATIQAPVLAGPPPTIIPILRAGLGMAEALVDLIPTASVGHIGIYRDHVTKEPVEYLVRLPPIVGQNCIITDPMLATGHSLIHACGVLNKNGVENSHIRVMALVAAPEGMEAFAAVYPTIQVYCAALDSHLDENSYIIPGLGDAGDRIFGT